MIRLAGKLGIVLLVLTLLASCAQAAKYAQGPKKDLSYDFSSEDKEDWVSVMADDWVCPDGVAISGITWWGSYWMPPAPSSFTIYSDTMSNAAPGGVVSFKIRVFANTAPTPSIPFDHPNYASVLGLWDVPYANVNEALDFTVVKQASPSVVEDVYKYSVDLTKTQAGMFAQIRDQKYWLSIQAMFPASNAQWGWHESDVHRWGYAVQAINPVQDPGWYIPCGGHDMAFELEAVPEPASLAALATGLGALGFGVRRLRKRS